MAQLWNRTRLNVLSLVIFGALSLLPLAKSSAPTFFTKPNNVTVKNGQNALFRCEASGFPVPTITWYMKGIVVKKIMLRHYVGLLFKTLYIMPAYWSDTGQITCEASNRYGTIRAHAYLRVVTKTKPTWKIKPRNMTVYDGKKFTILCSANGFPDPMYTWSKGDYLADKDSSIIVTPDGDMRFASAFVSQSGEYTCAASNSAGSISKTIWLDVLKDPSIVKDPTDAMGVIGQELLLQCDVVGSPSTKVTWKKDNKPINIKADPRKSVTVQLKDRTIHVHTLIIQHAKNSDSGKYQCVASNHYGIEISQAAMVNITGYSQPPTIKLAYQVIITAMDSDIKLKCIFTGTPLPQITWLKYVGNAAIVLKITSGDRLNMDTVETTLEINKAAKTDEGHYVCMGHNGAGAVSGNITFKVQEDPRKPEAIPSQSKFTAMRGTNATLKCTFTGNPQPEVTWFKHGIELEDSLGEMILGSNDTYSDTLMLAYVEYSDTGPYVCEAQNPHGKAQMTINLVVEGIPLPPTDLNFNRTSKTELFVSWKPGRSVGTDVKFLIEYKHSEEDSWTEVDVGRNTSKVLINVDGWEMVSIRVRARNRHGTSKPSHTLTIQGFDNVIATNRPGRPEKSFAHEAVVGGAVAALVLALAMVVVGLLLWRNRKRKSRLSRQPRSTPSVVYVPRNHEEEVLLEDQGNAYSYVPVSIVDGAQDPRQPMAEENEYETVGKPTSWEFPKRCLSLSENLGKGHFGKVVKAVLKTKTGSKPVAVKMLKENAEPHHKKDFLAELELMKSIGPHPNVVGLVGCCTKGENPFIIVEFCSTGNLRDFLRKSRGNCEYSNLASGSISLASRDLLSFMWQVARGMSFLASKKLVHRDLAARNVLVHEGNVCKIADFGLARNIYQENQYLKTTEGELPLRWMALESIFHGITTIESDVWSYGILMWEIITLGGNPYPGFTREQLISNLHLGYRMPRPPYCNEELYGVIWQCWQKEPSERPTFPMLCRTLHRMMAAEKILIDLVNFDAEYINAKKDGEPVSP